MKTDEIVRLTPKRVARLVRARQEREAPELFEGKEHRSNMRWPFMGAVELWPAAGDGQERWYATCQNLSEGGMGMVTEDAFDTGTPVELACHLPEASFFGFGTIRHCTEIPDGYLVGIEFDFSK